MWTQHIASLQNSLSVCGHSTLRPCKTQLLGGEGGVKRLFRGREIDTLDQFQGFGGAALTLHPAVFPFHRERPLIADLVERANNLLEVDAAAPRRNEIPAAPTISE